MNEVTEFTIHQAPIEVWVFLGLMCLIVVVSLIAGTKTLVDGD
jgi:hypothetical protein